MPPIVQRIRERMTAKRSQRARRSMGISDGSYGVWSGTVPGKVETLGHGEFKTKSKSTPCRNERDKGGAPEGGGYGNYPSDNLLGGRENLFIGRKFMIRE
jgi:hypothetical protein